MTLSDVLAVLIGGFAGAPCRYLVDRYFSSRWESHLPWGTFLVNISGSFALGLLTGLALGQHLAAIDKTLLGTGFCGAYTTFSTFSFETARLIESGDVLEAVLNIGASAIVGLAAAGVGLAIGLAL